MTDLQAASATPEGRLTSRSIRSFVLRQGRMSDAQHRYLADMMPRVGIPYRPALLDLTAPFRRAAPTVVEIGFGMGVATAAIATARPEDNFIGIDVHAPGVGSLCKLIAESGPANLRIIQHDAVEGIRRPGSRPAPGAGSSPPTGNPSWNGPAHPPPSRSCEPV